MRILMAKKNLSPLIVSKETALRERLLFLFGGGLFSSGLFSFFGGHSFYFLVLLNFGIFSFSEGAGIMLAAAEFVNGVKQNIFGRVPS